MNYDTFMFAGGSYRKGTRSQAEGKIRWPQEGRISIAAEAFTKGGMSINQELYKKKK